MIHLPPNFPFESRFLISMLITVIVETAVILALLRFLFKLSPGRIGWTRCLFAGFYASFATIPYLWFVLPAYIGSYIACIFVGEIGAFILEAIAYVFFLNLPLRRAAVLSLIANMSSIAVGLILLPPF